MQPQPNATVRDAVAGRIPSQDRNVDSDDRHSYHNPRRWATPARRRTDVYVVDLARPSDVSSSETDEDPLLLIA
jgi:hypothetical protein